MRNLHAPLVRIHDIARDGDLKDMKPDFELVRAILLALGDGEDSGRDSVCLNVQGWTREEVSRHVGFLHEAGLVDAVNLSPPDGCQWVPGRLTERGQEFLALARDDGLWKQAEKKMGKKNSFLGVLKQMLFDLVTSIFGL